MKRILLKSLSVNKFCALTGPRLLEDRDRELLLFSSTTSRVPGDETYFPRKEGKDRRIKKGERELFFIFLIKTE